MNNKGKSVISTEQRQLFRDDGYMVLESVIDPDMLAMLRQECSYFIGYMDARMDAGQLQEGALSSRDNRYFINNLYRYSNRLWQFLFSDLMADVCRNTIGQDAVLFHEQWVVKGPDQGMKFSWHQDSGYVKGYDPDTTHAPYVTCWCTLDDVSEANGSVYLLPHSRANTRGNIITHERETGSNDLVGYTGNDPGILIEAPAGSIVAFSSYNLHRSGANTTDRMRRIYLPQYASAPIIHSQSGEQLNLAVPFLTDGNVVYDRDTDNAANWGGLDSPAKAA